MRKLVWRFFISLSLVFVCAGAIASTCQSSGYHSQVQVKRVIDATTIQLVSGQHVRLIGVKLPTTQGKANDKQARQVAEQSNLLLKQTLATAPEIKLVLDKNLLDHNNHMLAHVFLPSDQNVQQLLLQQGAVQLDIQQPNTMFWRCYYQAQLDALNQHTGLWAFKAFQAQPAEQAKASQQANQNWSGKVVRVFQHKQATWLVINDWFYVEVPDKVKTRHFRQTNFKSLIGQQVIINSPVHYKNRRWQGLLAEPWQLIN
ncbi:nuclease [Catenovulum agarivorans DS-2]|uniref:Nuclease n=1 Tax=Catenovulum agarivorans DS-2 TaxID=1328313 RepID=W7QVP5_9ALTE|nr:thermonuclease family protein [Catenovulum agarivorans]EWH09355.1 nuclease [Catenovulum agarivorans DS-2]